MTRPEGNFRVDFLEHDGDVSERIPQMGLEKFVDYRLYKEDGKEHVVVLSSNDVLLVNILMRVFEDFDPATWNEEGFEDAFVAAEKPFSLIGRLPKTRFQRRGNRNEIVCEEGTCKFHSEGNCLKDKVTGEIAMQFDDNPANQWCMDYEPSDTLKADPPYRSLPKEIRADHEKEYHIRRQIFGNVGALANRNDLLSGFSGLASGVLMHLETGNVEIRIAQADDEDFKKTPGSMFAVGERPIGHWATGVYVKVNRNYENMRSEAPFSTDAMTIKAIAVGALEVAKLPFIPIGHGSRIIDIGEVDAMIAHQLVEAPPEAVFTSFTRSILDEHKRFHPRD